MGKFGKAVVIMSTALALGIWVFVDAFTCGPIATSLRPGHGLTGGPHYFRTFNHVCFPWYPLDLYTDGATPKSTENQVVAAWFDDMQRLVKTQKYYDRGKADWWQEATYDARGRLRTVTTGGGGAPTLRYDYSDGLFGTFTVTEVK